MAHTSQPKSQKGLMANMMLKSGGEGAEMDDIGYTSLSADAHGKFPSSSTDGDLLISPSNSMDLPMSLGASRLDEHEDLTSADTSSRSKTNKRLDAGELE